MPRPSKKSGRSPQNADSNFEKGVVAEENLQTDLNQLQLDATAKAVNAAKEVEKLQKEMDEEMLDDLSSKENLEKLSKKELIEKLLAARKSRNIAARKSRSKTKMNINNVNNLSAKLLKAEKDKKILKDRIEYLYKKCKENNIPVDLENYNQKIKEKEREFLNRHLY